MWVRLDTESRTVCLLRAQWKVLWDAGRGIKTMLKEKPEVGVTWRHFPCFCAPFSSLAFYPPNLFPSRPVCLSSAVGCSCWHRWNGSDMAVSPNSVSDASSADLDAQLLNQAPVCLHIPYPCMCTHIMWVGFTSTFLLYYAVYITPIDLWMLCITGIGQPICTEAPVQLRERELTLLGLLAGIICSGSASYEIAAYF